MRPKERIPRILYKLGKYWKNHPDLRIGQIIDNFSVQAEHGDDPAVMRDGDFEKVLDEKLENDEI